MGQIATQQIKIFPLKRIAMSWGDVLHAYKSGDQGLGRFGEVYFSWVKNDTVRDWKCHQLMTMNLVVPVGMVRFAFFEQSLKHTPRFEKIGEQRYVRLSVPPGIWFSFRNVELRDSLVVNFADMLHDPNEVIRKPSSEISIDWGEN